MSGLFRRYDEQEIRERIERADRTDGSLQHRIDKDWRDPLYQGRCGYCWAYAPTGAMQALDAAHGRPHVPLGAASVAAQVKRGKDDGGWPIQWWEFASRAGVASKAAWGDCTCRGSSCGGPSRGCPARDLSQVEATKEGAALRKPGDAYEVPEDDFLGVCSAIHNGAALAVGWTFTGAWCDFHAMLLTRVVIDPRGRLALVPENSWGEHQRRKLVYHAPTGGIALLSNDYDQRVL